MYTIRDVAKLADVSISTASAVINGKRTVRETLRQRVLRAMEALDYHPDTVARSLKVRRTNTVGIVVPDVTNPFYPEIMRGIEDVARRNGYSVLFCDANEDADLERLHLSTLFSRRVDGVVIAPTDPAGACDRLARQRIPFVLCDRVPLNKPCVGVITDNLEASRSAVLYLVALGHTRVAIVVPATHLRALVDRVEGFRQALIERHVAVREDYIRVAEIGEGAQNSAYQCGLELLRLPEPPTAIFCANNKMTLGLMRALGDLHLSCPERISIVGFDDFDWAASTNPRVTTVAQPSFEVGKQAMELLLPRMTADQHNQPKEDSQVIVLQSQLRIRNSAAPPPRGFPS